jgi:hypothetical protein
VCQAGGLHALSHWGIGGGQILCLSEGMTIADLIAGATFNGEPVDLVVGLDPTTQVYGFKLDNLESEYPCNEYTITFDTSVLVEGITLGIGSVGVSTKAGNQDISNQKRNEKPKQTEGERKTLIATAYIYAAYLGWSVGNIEEMRITTYVQMKNEASKKVEREQKIIEKK